MPNKIDYRKNYILVLDIETANITEEPLAYDIGFAVADRKGNIYETYSFMVAEMFLAHTDLMRSAYYANKLPQYYLDYFNGNREMRTLMNIRSTLREVMERYRIKDVYAYNCAFDRKGLDNTIRYLTKSTYRWFFPYGTKFHCIWHIACQTILQQKRFYKFALENNLVSASGNVSTSAETAYRYICKDNDFTESHTGLEDVRIETAILAKCMKQHKKVDTSIKRNCWQIPQKKFKKLAKSA